MKSIIDRRTVVTPLLLAGAALALIFANSPAFTEDGAHKPQGHHTQNEHHAEAKKQGGICPDELKGVEKTVKTLENGVELTMTAGDAEGVAEVQHTAAAHYAEEGKNCHCLPEGAAVKLENLENGVKIVITGGAPELVEKIQAKYEQAHDCACCKDKAAKAVQHKITKEEIGMEAVCPVMGDVFKVTAKTLAASYKGKVYYFCCPGCEKPFLGNPEKYLNKKQAAQHKKYICPMGCAESDKPGKCPKCGMNLVKKK